MRFDYYTTTDKGDFRKSNQDCAYAATSADGTAFFGIVCDGMGGLSHGEVASSTVVESFTEWFTKEFATIQRDELFADNVALGWQRIITDTNERLRQMSSKDQQSMGTTLSVLLLTQDRFYAAQIGDSRIYVGNEAEEFFVALTKDHSYVADMVEQGLMTAEQARVSNEKNILTRCIGVMREVQADYYDGELHSGDFFVICSDGFCSGTLPSDILRAMGLHGSNKQFSQQALETAVRNRRAAGERDNITAVLTAVNGE